MATTAQASFQTKGGAGTHAFLGSQPIKGTFGLAKANGYGSSTTAAQVVANWDGTGKVILITGASAGLGLESARVLSARGAEVILAVRNPAKAEKALATIKAAAGPDAKVTSMALDLNSLASVKAFAQEFRASGRKLHVLLNNAGIMATPFGLSKDGYEQQFATNHLGHFLLTKLLLDKVIATAKEDGTEGRIITLTSYGHGFAPKDLAKASKEFELEQLSSGDGYDPFACKGYGRSKLASILFTRQLAEELKGQPVIAACCHPGFINTGLSDHLLPWLPPGMIRTCVLGFADKVLLAPVSKTVPQGAATQVFLASAPKGQVLAGEYYSDCNLEMSSKVSHSRALAKQLWEVSEQVCSPFV